MSDLPSLDDECFFIAPIGDDDSEERRRSDGVLEFIVARAASELGLAAVRADQIAEPGQITVQVLDHVIRSKVAVADLTGLNPNVFYELAVRHTVKRPVALIAEKGSKLPFDVGQMRTIFFDHRDLKSADSCRKDIVAHLRQALDRGTSDSPIAMSVDLAALQAGGAVERTVAELAATVDDLARLQRETLRRLDMRGVRGPTDRRLLQEAVHEASELLQSAASSSVSDYGRTRMVQRAERLLEVLEAAAGQPLGRYGITRVSDVAPIADTVADTGLGTEPDSAEAAPNVEPGEGADG